MSVTPETNPSLESVSSDGRGDLLGYALWKYQGSQWELAKDCSVKGARNSGPPSVAGNFDGQVRATPSVAG